MAVWPAEFCSITAKTNQIVYHAVQHVRVLVKMGMVLIGAYVYLLRARQNGMGARHPG